MGMAWGCRFCQSAAGAFLHALLVLLYASLQPEPVDGTCERLMGEGGFAVSIERDGGKPFSYSYVLLHLHENVLCKEA